MTAAEKKMRTFLALTPSVEVAAEIASLQQAIGRHRLNIKWVLPENLHLTLKFLGELTPAQIDRVCRAATRAAPCVSPPIKLSARGLGVFPHYRRPRVIWTGLSGDTPPLFALQETLADNLAEIGFAKEKRKFTAHLTIGRIKAAIDGKALAAVLNNFLDFHSKPFYLERFILYKSVLGSRGPTYSRLAEFPLGDPGSNDNRP